MARYIETIYPIMCQQSLKESVNSDGQRISTNKQSSPICTHCAQKGDNDISIGTFIDCSCGASAMFNDKV